MSERVQKHLLVDGSNIGRAWPEVAALWRRNPANGRGLLVRLLAPLHDFGGWRISVVVDGSGAELSTERVGDEASFLVAITPRGTTADDLIEQWVAASAHPSACVVASGDRALRQTVTAAGGEWMSAADLARHVERAVESGTRAMQRARRQADIPRESP